MRTTNHFIALQYTKALIEDQKDGRAMRRTSGQQALLASATKETLRTEANDRRLMTKQVELLDEAMKVGEKAFAAVSQVVGIASGAALKVPDVAPKDVAPKDVAPKDVVPEDVAPKEAATEAPEETNPADEPSRLERYVRANFVTDTKDDVRQKASEELEKKLFQAMNVGTESFGRAAQGMSKVVEDAKATAKQASGLASGQKLRAQRLVDLVSRAPADV